jgi:hypothetical protein
MDNFMKAASDTFSKATAPIGEAVDNFPGVKKAADDVSIALTEKKHKEGTANIMRTAGLTGAGQAVGGPKGAAMGAAAGDALRND